MSASVLRAASIDPKLCSSERETLASSDERFVIQIMASVYDIHEAARDCDVEGLRRCLTPPFVGCPSTAVVTATGRHAMVLQRQSVDLLYVELDGNENAEGSAFERKTIR